MPPTQLDIPYSVPSQGAELLDKQARIEITPNSEHALSYELVVPKHWAYSERFGPVPDGLLLPRGIGIFAASLDVGAPVIAVTVTTVPFEVPVDAWTRLELERDGWDVIAVRWFPGPNGLFCDVTGVRIVNDEHYIRRSSARVDGAHVFLVNTSCERARWDEVKHLFWTVHITFALLGGSASTQMEPWAEATTTLAPAFEIVHPLSWISEPAHSNVPNVSGIHLRLTDAEQTKLLAYMLVRSERKESDQYYSLVRLTNEMLALLERSGLSSIGDLHPLEGSDDPRSIAVPGWRAGYWAAARLAEADISLRLGFIERGDVLYQLALYNPRSQDDVLIALRAQRAFEIVRAGLQRTD